jgi:RNA polymerase sigma factor (sigma-70 family)
VEKPVFDERFIAGLQKGDPQIQAAFVAFFRTPTWVMARRRLRSLELSEDVAQETLMRVLRYFQSGKGLDDPKCLPGFVWGTCKRVILEIHNKEPHRPTPGNWDVPDGGRGPEEQAVTEERKRIVRKILSRLRPRYRDLLVQAWIEEKEPAELCARFGVDPDYLRVLMFRARQKFKEAVLKAGFEGPSLNPGPE